ncbi:MAG: Acetylornithine/succinyldiaminopimelate aminotransferase [Firmicutes bacterium]|nr:Acetylornithine/succinyldiaminopimelate aminotransferase [Bacillota bacterium]
MDRVQLVSETLDKYEKYVNPSLARLFRFMGLATVEWQADGSIIRDIDGKEYIDCLGGYGVFSLGHRHPKVVEAVKRQLELMPLSSKVLLDKPMADLAELLAEITPGDLTYSFIVNSGAEAVEGALKLARVHTGRAKVVSAINSFHGKTFGALSATGRDLFREPFQPLLSGFTHIPYGNVEALEMAVDADTAAIILEPIQGEGGIIVPPDEYLPAARAIASHYGAMLICDEVQTGLGRTGKMFAVDYSAVVPDIITTAKALGGGVMPVGAFTARPEVWQKYIDAPFLHTSTFGGNPLACAAAIAAIQVVRDEELAERAAESGAYLIGALKQLAKAYPEVISEVRGRGLMIGMDLTKEGTGGFLMAELINHGILVAYTLNNPKVIRIEPPLAIEQELVDKVIAAFTDAIKLAADMIEDL